MSTDLDIHDTAARGTATRELLVIVGLALAGVILASLATFAPWYGVSPWAPARHSQVVGFLEPAAPGAHG
jgi:hypothetical protein